MTTATEMGFASRPMFVFATMDGNLLCVVRKNERIKGGKYKGFFF